MKTATNLELELLEREVDEQGRFVLRLVRGAVEAFRNADAASAQVVIGLEREVCAAHDRIGAAASRLLSERWEVSAEVRRAVAARRVNDELEGMAELALAIARLARPAGTVAAPAVVDLDELALAAEACAHGALDAYASRSTSRAGVLVASDMLVDEAMRDAAAAVMARAANHPGGQEWALRAMLTARCLRRISRHAMRIAAQAGFVTTGKAPEIGPSEAACRAY
ncbi:MAG: PhoU domain-containing protein [Gaiellales bacterium]